MVRSCKKDEKWKHLSTIYEIIKYSQFVQQSVATIVAGLRSACTTSLIIAASDFTSAQITEHLKSIIRIFIIILDDWFSV